MYNLNPAQQRLPTSAADAPRCSSVRQRHCRHIYGSRARFIVSVSTPSLNQVSAGLNFYYPSGLTMSSTEIDVAKPLSGRPLHTDEEKAHHTHTPGPKPGVEMDEARKSPPHSGSVSVEADDDDDSSPVSTDHTARRLRSRHIQLIGIGGTIGTALYVQIGRGLLNGGPASLFLAFTLW